MSGIELIISSICNVSFCSPTYDNPLPDVESLMHTEYITLVNEINGKHLKIATYNNYPLSWAETDDNGTFHGQGVAFTIVDILQKKFNFTFEVVVPKQNFEMGGGNPEDSLVGLVNSNQVDMAAAFVPNLAINRRMVSFSIDLDEGVWMMMLKRPKVSAAGTGLLAPFTSFVWYLILASVVAYGPCITLVTWIQYKLVRDKERYLPLSPSFWFVYSAFIKQGTNLSPDANTTRMLFATWWIFIILLSAFYTANLTAFLTLSKFTLDIENPVDLYKKNYRWVADEGSSLQYNVKYADPNDELFFLYEMVRNGRAEFRALDTDADYLPLVRDGAVLVKEQTAIYHLMYRDYQKKARDGVSESRRCTYVVAPNAFMKKRRAFAYPLGSNLKRLFDPILGHILQAGIIDFLVHRDLPETKICPLDLQSTDRQLTNSDLMMTYYIMIFGLAVAIAVFVAEVLIKRYLRIKIKTGDSQKRRKSKYNQNFVTGSYDDSRPPPYESLFANPKYKSTKDSRIEMINGREYYVFDNGHGGNRLIPVRAPSALLYR